VDLDGDGRTDILSGSFSGEIFWFRRKAGTEFEPGRPLADHQGKTIRVVDFNGDGRLDLLVGDISGNFQGKPTQSAKERAEEDAARRKLPAAMKAWAATFQKYRELLTAPPASTPVEKESRAKQLDTLRKDLRHLKEEIASAQKTIEHYQPQRQSHGYVWLFLRKPRK
jgi:hypothetical protein